MRLKRRLTLKNSIIRLDIIVLHVVLNSCWVAGVHARVPHENINIVEKCNLKDIVK